MECSAHARVALANHEVVIRRLCSHLLEHGGLVEERDGAHLLRLGDSRARFARDGDATRIEVTTADLEKLYQMRSFIASHILEFAEGPAPEIRWSGDGGDLARPPNFQILTVVAARDVTPHMRRLTLAGPGVGRFAAMTALHLQILVQHPDLTEPQWPGVGADGLVQWADPERRPVFRKYTVRALDLAAGTIDVDFVLHADAGPGSAFALAAKPGDEVGVIGPGGGGLAEADWYLFAGDETALPAIARMLEHLPESARGRAVIEVADAGEIQPLAVKAAVEVEWLLRDGAAPGTTRLLPDAVRAIALPRDGSRIHVWAGCEYQAFRAIRSHLRDDCGLKANEHLVVAYWRLDGEEGEA